LTSFGSPGSLYQKARRDILPRNWELTVSPEVAKRLVHNLRKDEEKEEISEKKLKPAKKKLPYLFIKALDAVSLSRRRGEGEEGS